MSLTVFLAVMAAALMHAGWNAVIKLGNGRANAMLMMTLAHGAIGVAVALTQPLPGAEIWPWLIASGLFHAAYKAFLAFAYAQGDLSRVYPIARGTAPLVVLLLGPLLLLDDSIAPGEYLGILVLGAGIMTMARGVFRNGESRRLLPFALGSALATAGYSIVDGMGARLSGDAVMYVAWLLVIDAAIYATVTLAAQGRAPFRSDARGVLLGSIAAAASYAAYSVAVWAMTQAPIALVAALRETSILFAVLIGWLVFGDRMDRGKIAGAALIVAGVALTRL